MIIISIKTHVSELINDRFYISIRPSRIINGYDIMVHPVYDNTDVESVISKQRNWCEKGGRDGDCLIGLPCRLVKGENDEMYIRKSDLWDMAYKTSLQIMANEHNICDTLRNFVHNYSKGQ